MILVLVTLPKDYTHYSCMKLSTSTSTEHQQNTDHDKPLIDQQLSITPVTICCQAEMTNGNTQMSVSLPRVSL